MISLKISMGRHEDMIDYQNDSIVSEYFSKTQENFLYCLLFPFFLVYLIFYGIYLAFYGILMAVFWVQDWGIMALGFNIDNQFLRILALIILIPVNLALYILSTIISLPAVVILFIFYGILSIIAAIF